MRAPTVAFCSAALAMLPLAACAPPPEDAPPTAEETAPTGRDLAPEGTMDADHWMSTGDPERGRQAFLAMSCHSCHEVEGDGFPDPVADPPVPVALGPELASKPKSELVASVIEPSHFFAAGSPGVESGGLSRMGDYSEAMTVRQLIDLVAFLQSLGGAEARAANEAEGGTGSGAGVGRS